MKEGYKPSIDAITDAINCNMGRKRISCLACKMCTEGGSKDTTDCIATLAAWLMIEGKQDKVWNNAPPWADRAIVRWYVSSNPILGKSINYMRTLACSEEERRVRDIMGRYKMASEEEGKIEEAITEILDMINEMKEEA